MTVEQLALDLWALIPPQPRPVNPHQRGQIRLPYDTVGGWKAGDLVPAWVCCLCGGVSASEYVHGINHGCCRRGLAGMCQIVRPNNHLNPHWIPPSTEDRP